MFYKKRLAGGFLLFFFIPFLAFAYSKLSPEAIIYYNEACSGCAVFVNQELPKILEQKGIAEIVKKDYINQKEYRTELNELFSQWKIPYELQSHIMTFVNEKIVLAGHVPANLIDEAFAKQDEFAKLLLYQDEMHGEITAYKIWNFEGEIKEYPLQTSISEYLENPGKYEKASRNLLPLVLWSGFVDGLNPCAFAVLLFFIAFLFTIGRTKKYIWKIGLVYIMAIYLAYLLIGLGLLKAIIFSGSPHFMAKLGAWLVIILGIINLLNYLFPQFPLKLHIPALSKDLIQKWMAKASVPAAFISGFLVGLCTFPCSGGIYVAIVGLLASQATKLQGILYLLLYNLMFVSPLVIILILAANPKSVEKLTALEAASNRYLRLGLALAMIVLGVVILLLL